MAYYAGLDLHRSMSVIVVKDQAQKWRRSSSPRLERCLEQLTIQHAIIRVIEPYELSIGHLPFE